MEDITYRIEKCDGKVQWDEFVLEHGGHPLQLWGWGDTRSSLGWRVDRVFVVEEAKQVGAAQLLIRKLPRPFNLCVYLAKGPIIVENETAVYEQLIEYVKKNYHGVGFIAELNGDGEPAGTGWRETDSHALASESLLLNLTKADGVLLAEMSPETREHLRTAGQSLLSVKRVGTPEGITDCYQLYLASHQGSEKPYKEKYFQDLHDKLGEYSVVLGAYEDETLVSFIWLAVSETMAFELYTGTSARGHELAASYGLRWEVIRRVKQWGVPVYDVGGIRGESDEKRGFGTETSQCATYVLPLSPFYSIWARASRNRSRYGL
jgi:lipid II:glycine glycyltransferase (peptidoglycan interpeptide bridge formation enzyme)